jgi:PTH1 family peptidyl-tRNA hydrolase
MSLFRARSNPPAWLIVGLGNPGPRYEHTRHNAGFKALDALAASDDVRTTQWIVKADALLCSAHIKDVDKIELAKPQAFMNNSGSSVKRLCAHFGLEAPQVLVVHDDLDLPAGTLRLKVGGGHGGHNGLRDIIARIGPGFTRLRVGIGRPPGQMSAYDFVLQEIKATTLEDFEVTTAQAVDVLLYALREGTPAAMTKYH